jgi:cytochrome b6-f complex iron-sulfur subunit
MQMQETKPQQTNRRTLLNRIWMALGTLAFLQVSWIGGSTLWSRKKRKSDDQPDEQLTIGSIDTYPEKSVTAIPRGRFYLTHLADGSFIALSPICTHLGCTISWDKEQNIFTCPCHGSTFNNKGEVLTSPATRPLDFFPVRLENGMVRVDLSDRRKRSQFDATQTAKV